jgi:glycine betaine catabolism A
MATVPADRRFQNLALTSDFAVDPSRRLLNLLEDHRATTPLPRELYTLPEIYQLDLASIWYHDWLFAGHESELQKPGDFLTLQVGEYPIIVLRDRDHAVRAFHNTCRHRGSRICSQDHGHASRLVCPYHQWTYRLDGTLLAARDMGEAFDRSEFALKAVHCVAECGYIWICLAETPPSLEPFLQQVRPYLGPHQLRDTKVAFESRIVEKANWKLVWENNRECYHCPANHPSLSLTFPAGPTVAIQQTADGGTGVDEWNRWESAGLPSRFCMADDGVSRVVRMSLLKDSVSYTMDGLQAVQRPLSDAVTISNPGVLLMFNYPTTWNHIMRDHAITFRLLPISPIETELTTKWLVHKDAQEGVDYDLKRLTEVWVATNDEDRRVCQENQIGVTSPAYEPSPYSPVHEPGVMQFVEWYRNRMIHRLADMRSTR